MAVTADFKIAHVWVFPHPYSLLPFRSRLVVFREGLKALGRVVGVGGGYLVESTGYLIKYPFYMLVRVRVRACCNGN